jgi:hypothetical protein
MNRRVATVAAAALLIGGCGGSSPAPSPTRAAKTTTTHGCPITPRQFVNGRLGSAQGDGRVRYIGLPRGRVTRIAPPYTPDSGFRHSAWGGQKVMFVFRHIEGVIEIRGHRLDGPGDVRFGHDRDPADVWRLGWINRSSRWGDGVGMVRLKGPGCYAYDITAPGVHETIVFRAAVWQAD